MSWTEAIVEIYKQLKRIADILENKTAQKSSQS